MRNFSFFVSLVNSPFLWKGVDLHEVQRRGMGKNKFAMTPTPPRLARHPFPKGRGIDLWSLFYFPNISAHLNGGFKKWVVVAYKMI